MKYKTFEWSADSEGSVLIKEQNTESQFSFDAQEDLSTNNERVIRGAAFAQVDDAEDFSRAVTRAREWAKSSSNE